MADASKGQPASVLRTGIDRFGDLGRATSGPIDYAAAHTSHRSAPPARPGRARRGRRGLARELWKNAAFRALVLALLAARLVWRREQWPVDVECYPDVPSHKYAIWKVALFAGIRLVPATDRPVRGAIAGRPRLRLLWLDRTDIGPTALERVAGPAWGSAINRNLLDISKRRIEQVFAATFGYPLAVDPMSEAGPYLAKSNANSLHDGRVLTSPVDDLDPDLVYERLLDNRADAATVVDYRVAVVGDRLPLVYLKYRPLATRFSNRNSRVALATAQDVFSSDECQKITAFCRAMELDLGELDVLRDAADGRIYIVDVNKTVFGPPKPIATADAVQAVRLYAAALRGYFGGRLE